MLGTRSHLVLPAIESLLDRVTIECFGRCYCIGTVEAGIGDILGCSRTRYGFFLYMLFLTSHQTRPIIIGKDEARVLSVGVHQQKEDVHEGTSLFGHLIDHSNLDRMCVNTT